MSASVVGNTPSSTLALRQTLPLGLLGSPGQPLPISITATHSHSALPTLTIRENQSTRLPLFLRTECPPRLAYFASFAYLTDPRYSTS